MNSFEYMQPAELAEAFSVLRNYGPEARVLAGGTDLTVALREGRLKSRVIVDLKRIADLSSEIELRDDRVVIGARATMSDLARHAGVGHFYPALVEAAAVVGSVQIRNRATLVGNVCNASPAADTVPVLAACGANVEIGGCAGSRLMPLIDFIQGNRRIVLGPRELVTAVHLPAPARARGMAFERMTRRRGVDLATVNVCCAVDGTGATTFAFGAVAPKPFMVRDSGQLADAGMGESDRDALMSTLFAEAAPITDVRAGADYRRGMMIVLARRALARAIRRLAGDRNHA